MPRFEFKDLPATLAAYTFLGFTPEEQAGKEYVGNCVICGRSEKKFYVNGDTGLFNCKHGSCGVEGNVSRFLNLAFEAYTQDAAFGHASIADFRELEKDRGIPRHSLKRMGLIKIGDYWLVPVKDYKGSIVSMRQYKYGQKIQAVKGLPVGLFGSESLGVPEKKNLPVYIVEGEWDKIATEEILNAANVKAIVVGTPGSGIFKDNWLHLFQNRNVISLFDKDLAGTKGTIRLHNKITGVVKSHKTIEWPDELALNFDMRDFYIEGGTYDALQQLIHPYKNPTASISEKKENSSSPDSTNEQEKEDKQLRSYPPYDYSSYPLARNGDRPSITSVLEAFRKHLKMTQELDAALRVMYASIIMAQFEGDPLWIHVTAPPGWAKTELLMSCECDFVNVISSTTSAALISGARMKDGEDPSQIPQQFGKTLVMKDFTEILRMPVMEKNNIYNILRGAYDGVAIRIFGNGVPSRRYEGFFSCLTGVTHEILADQEACVGERFLMFKVTTDPNAPQKDTLKKAMRNIGKKGKMREDLKAASNSFLAYRYDDEDLPEISEEYEEQIISLAQMVAMLRTSVSKDSSTGYVNYRPQTETPTRLVTQLAKLAMGLGMQHFPFRITEEDMRIVQHVALSTCIAWNLEAVYFIQQKPGQTIDQLSTAAEIPLTTLREQLDAMYMTGVLKKTYAVNPLGRGRSIAEYHLSPSFQKHWEGAKMNEYKMYGSKISQLKGLLTVPAVSIEQSPRKIKHVIVDNAKPKIKLRKVKKEAES